MPSAVSTSEKMSSSVDIVDKETLNLLNRGLTVGMIEMYRLVCRLMLRPESIPFHKPVDFVGLGLKEYTQIITRPMDLGTVREAIRSGQFKTVHEAYQDVNLVWSNCMTFNEYGSDFYYLAERLKKTFDEAYEAVKWMDSTNTSSLSSPLPSSIPRVGVCTRPPTSEERLQLSQNVFRLTVPELTAVLTRLEEDCPYAIATRAATDELLINFDAVPATTFHNINTYVLSSILNSVSPSKSTKKR